MAETSDNLNALLEDALQDLLLDDDEKPQEQEQQQQQQPQQPPVDKPAKQPAKKKKQQKAAIRDEVDEEEMNQFFARMNEQLKAELPKIDPEEAQSRINESVPQIFDLMQNLLSKELLYPALKDLAPKFDDWLKRNLPTLSKEEKARYKQQIIKINEIIEVFDNESLDTQEKFEKNLDLMEQMQALGAPPDELTVPEGMSKCSIM